MCLSGPVNDRLGQRFRRVGSDGVHGERESSLGSNGGSPFHEVEVSLRSGPHRRPALFAGMQSSQVSTPIQRNLWRTWPDFLFDFRNNNLHRHSYNDALISWQHFCKELLPDRTFTFWEWFHRAMDLTQVNESKI